MIAFAWWSTDWDGNQTSGVTIKDGFSLVAAVAGEFTLAPEGSLGCSSVWVIYCGY